MKRGTVILLSLIVISVFLVYRSCEVVPISKVGKGFDPKSYAQNVWLKLQAVLDSLGKADVFEVIEMLQQNPEECHRRYARVVGVSNYRYYIVEGRGIIKNVDDDGFSIQIFDHSDRPEFYINRRVFGNTIVMATGIIKMEDFDRIMDFNLVSTELNRIVSDEVVTAFLEHLKTQGNILGRIVNFIGLFTLLRDDPVKYPITMIPLKLELSQGGY